MTEVLQQHRVSVVKRTIKPVIHVHDEVEGRLWSLYDNIRLNKMLEELS